MSSLMQMLLISIVVVIVVEVVRYRLSHAADDFYDAPPGAGHFAKRYWPDHPVPPADIIAAEFFVSVRPPPRLAFDGPDVRPPPIPSPLCGTIPAPDLLDDAVARLARLRAPHVTPLPVSPFVSGHTGFALDVEPFWNNLVLEGV